LTLEQIFLSSQRWQYKDLERRATAAIKETIPEAESLFTRGCFPRRVIGAQVKPTARRKDPEHLSLSSLFTGAKGS